MDPGRDHETRYCLGKWSFNICASFYSYLLKSAATIFFFFFVACSCSYKQICLGLHLTAQGPHSAWEALPQYISLHIYRALSYTTRQPIDHCRAEMARFIKLGLRVHNKYTGTHTRRASQMGGGRAPGKETAKGRESQALAAEQRRRGNSALPDQDQVFLLKSFTLLQCKLYCSFKHRQTLPTISPWPPAFTCTTPSPCASHFPLTSWGVRNGGIFKSDFSTICACVCVPVSCESSHIYYSGLTISKCFPQRYRGSVRLKKSPCYS